jgi:hypothetical protein
MCTVMSSIKCKERVNLFICLDRSISSAVKQRFPTLEHVVEAGTSILSFLHGQHFHEHTRDKRFLMKTFENVIQGAFHNREKCYKL